MKVKKLEFWNQKLDLEKLDLGQIEDRDFKFLGPAAIFLIKMFKF